MITCRPGIHDLLHPYMIKIAEGLPHTTLPPLILRRYNSTIAALNICPGNIYLQPFAHTHHLNRRDSMQPVFRLLQLPSCVLSAYGLHAEMLSPAFTGLPNYSHWISCTLSAIRFHSQMPTQR